MKNVSKKSVEQKSYEKEKRDWEIAIMENKKHHCCFSNENQNLVLKLSTKVNQVLHCFKDNVLGGDAITLEESMSMWILSLLDLEEIVEPFFDCPPHEVLRKYFLTGQYLYMHKITEITVISLLLSGKFQLDESLTLHRESCDDLVKHRNSFLKIHNDYSLRTLKPLTEGRFKDIKAKRELSKLLNEFDSEYQAALNRMRTKVDIQYSYLVFYQEVLNRTFHDFLKSFTQLNWIELCSFLGSLNSFIFPSKAHTSPLSNKKKKNWNQIFDQVIEGNNQ